MGLLARSALVSMLVSTSACYAPDLRDCTVSCTAETDCASGQVCGSDRFCAAPEIAGRCASMPPGDGGVQPGHDAHPVDAESIITPDAPPDAPTTTTIHAHVEGQGRIDIDGLGSCASGEPQKGDCWFGVLIGAQISAVGVPNPNQRFDKWTLGPCIGSDSISCAFTATEPTAITAKFRKDD